MNLEQGWFGVDQSQGLQPGFFPEDAGRAIDASALTPAERAVVDVLRSNFQIPLAAEGIYRQGISPYFTNTWLESFRVTVHRIRSRLPEALSLYSIGWEGKYMLDWRRPIGSWFLRVNRAHFVSQVPEEVIGILGFANEVEVRSEEKLVPRMTPQELAVVNHLGIAYPESVSCADLVARFWSTKPGFEEYSLVALRSTISHLRGKLREYRGDPFTVEPIDHGYRLVRSTR